LGSPWNRTEQKSSSPLKSAEATYAEYCRQKANASGGTRVPSASLVTSCSFLPFVQGSVGESRSPFSAEFSWLDDARAIMARL
jgi:hypothetical protein